ncbi:hypothetical protein [Dongshaea marina]|uniref:hypothetical protein n=1 Tax=Dongshaea marina TaxID=2047966 RepID=UPI000D3EA734|nr:hypothetical protein [Dongshaea marina]
MECTKRVGPVLTSFLFCGICLIGFAIGFASWIPQQSDLLLVGAGAILVSGGLIAGILRESQIYAGSACICVIMLFLSFLQLQTWQVYL